MADINNRVTLYNPAFNLQGHREDRNFIEDLQNAGTQDIIGDKIMDSEHLIQEADGRVYFKLSPRELYELLEGLGLDAG